MATKTENDVVTLALKKCYVIGAGETPDSNDYDDALAEYISFHAWLKSRYTKTVHWTYDKVPKEVFVYVAAMLAEELLGTFDVSEEGRMRVLQGASRSERRFREYQTKKPRKTVQVQTV